MSIPDWQYKNLQRVHARVLPQWNRCIGRHRHLPTGYLLSEDQRMQQRRLQRLTLRRPELLYSAEHTARRRKWWRHLLFRRRQFGWCWFKRWKVQPRRGAVSNVQWQWLYPIRSEMYSYQSGSGKSRDGHHSFGQRFVSTLHCSDRDRSLHSQLYYQ